MFRKARSAKSMKAKIGWVSLGYFDENKHLQLRYRNSPKQNGEHNVIKITSNDDDNIFGKFISYFKVRQMVDGFGRRIKMEALKLERITAYT